MLMIWPVPDAPAMACHESGGPPARSVATLGGENHHLRVDGLHLRCPTNSSRAPQVPFLSTVRCPIASGVPCRGRALTLDLGHAWGVYAAVGTVAGARRAP